MGIRKREHYSLELNTFSLACDVLGHPGRVKIILLLLTNESMALGEIQQELGLSQSACSDQVRILRMHGLISGTQLGTSIRYRLNREMIQDIKDLSLGFWSEINTE